MNALIVSPPRKEFQTFHDFPLVTDLDVLTADVALLGVPFGDPYSMAEVSNDQSNAPTHIRRHCERALRGLDRYDFDIGGTMLDGRDIRVVDCGDVLAEARDIGGNHDRTERAMRAILGAGAMPIVMGGDHAIPIPLLRAFEGRGPITLVQIDAHVDWRDRFHGVDHGLSSVIRRASEMEHVADIWQIGLRAAGSGRPEEVQAAIDYGSNLVPDIELQEVGMQAILDRIPDGGQYYLTIDADGVDPSIMPAVAGPAPGGVTYPQMRTLINGLARKGRVVGMDVVEITPARDVNGITAITAGRFIVMMIGAAVRAGYFD